MKFKTTLCALAIAAAIPAAPALAQKSNFYAVAGVGRSTIDVDPNSINAFALQHGLATSSTSTDTKDFAWKLQLGYQFGKTFAWEFGYINLGKSEYVNTNNVYSARGNKQADLFNFDILGKWPLSQQLSLIGRVGVYRWETKANLPTPAGLTDRTDDGIDVKFGAGLQYDFGDRFGLRGSFDRFNGIGSSTTAGDSKVNFLSLDAVLKF